MSNKKISVDELSNVIIDYLNEFKDVTEESCRSGVLKTANEAVKELRNAHPAGSGEYQSWDEYNSGWTKRTERQKTRLGGVQATIWNKDHYQLTHLLENGHAKVNGGRTRAFPHIAPVEEKCEYNLIKNIKSKI